MQHGGQIARGVDGGLIGHRMARFAHADPIGQGSIDVVILGDDHAASQIVTQHFAHGIGHGHGGFARPDQEHALVVAQPVRSIGHQDLIAHARQELVDGLSRIDGGQRDLLKLLGSGA